MKETCKDCGRNFKTLTDANLCYYCFVNKYGKPPNTGIYKIEKNEKK